jgi:hypothetical protein
MLNLIALPAGTFLITNFFTIKISENLQVGCTSRRDVWLTGIMLRTGLRKKALRNLWSEALSSENFQLSTTADSSLRPMFNKCSQ